MTAFQIAKATSAMIGLTAPSTLFGTRDPFAKLLLALLDLGGQQLAKRRGPDQQTWRALTREYHFTTLAHDSTYPLPADLTSVVNGTVYNRSQERYISGSDSPQAWQSQVAHNIQPVYQSYRIIADENTGEPSIEFFGTITSGDNIVLEYCSRNWVKNREGVIPTQDHFTADNEVPAFPADLMQLDLTWRARKANGLQYAADLAEFENERDRTFALDVQPRDIALGRNRETVGDSMYPQRIPT